MLVGFNVGLPKNVQMYRQISEKHYGGGGGDFAPPPPLATVVYIWDRYLIYFGGHNFFH